MSSIAAQFQVPVGSMLNPWLAWWHCFAYSLCLPVSTIPNFALYYL